MTESSEVQGILYGVPGDADMLPYGESPLSAVKAELDRLEAYQAAEDSAKLLELFIFCLLRGSMS